jgi:hypothetical protein
VLQRPRNVQQHLQRKFSNAVSQKWCCNRYHVISRLCAGAPAHTQCPAAPAAKLNGLHGLVTSNRYCVQVLQRTRNVQQHLWHDIHGFNG